MSISITKNTSTVNTTAKSGRTISYIVLHYTAGTSSASGAAKSVADYFKGGSAGGSADFIVDDSNIIQYNPDIKNRYTWAVGGSKYSSMSTSEGGKYYGKCTNANSISIEMCSRKTNKSSLLASDTDWYLTDATIAKAAELTKYLMQQYGIDTDHVIMHHHVTGKVCPNPWCVNSSRLTQWEAFKAKLTATTTASETKSFIYINAAVLGKNCTFTGFMENNENWIKATAALEAIGYTAKWNSTKKRVIAVKNGTEKLLDIRTYISASSISFCPLRELYEYLGYNVNWDSSTGKITVTE